MITIVGEAPVGDVPALHPATRTGARLYRWIGDLRVRRVNLLDSVNPAWDAADRKRAKDKARRIARRGGTIVLLGRNVAGAFGMTTAKFYAWQRKRVCVPHPSGRSRHWNEQRNLRRAARWWAALRRGDA